MKKIVITLTLLCVVAFAQQKGTFKDARDGKTYKTVIMGAQTWMAENLNYAAKGSKCGGATPKTETYESIERDEGGIIISKTKQTRKYFVLEDNNNATCNKYGRLYDYETAIKACPQSWHLPVKAEWEYLVKFAGDNEAAKTDYERWSQAGKYLKAKSGWNTSNGEDKFGFTALPGGTGDSAAYGSSSNAKKLEFTNAGDFGNWLTATAENDKIYTISMNSSSDEVRGVSFRSKNGFSSVRCVQGASSEEAIAAVEKAAADEKEAAEKAAVESAIGKQFNPKINYGSITDARDKATYKTVKIGNQTWMAENLNYDAKGSKCFKDKDYYCKKDGRLYDWEMAKTACPAGWHLPSKAEWNTLGEAVGGLTTAGTKLKATSGWFEKYNSKKPVNGTDDFGFSAIPAGSGGWNNGKDFSDRNESVWWTTSGNDYGTVSKIYSSESETEKLSLTAETKTLLFNIRCVQGEASKEEPVAKPAEQPKQAEQPKKADSPKQQSSKEYCNLTFPKKMCVEMPKNACKLAGGKTVDKCK